MQTFRRHNRLAAFGLVDTLVGLLLLVAVSGLLFSGFSTLLTLNQRQETKTEVLLGSVDAQAYRQWL